MGFRQPTATGAFFAQAKAGAEEQKKAREKLQKPQALGGSAAVGTQMVAATTGQQQQASQQVQQAGQQAQKDIQVKPNNLGTSMTSAITPSTPTQPVAEIKMDTGEMGDVGRVEASNTAITKAIDTTTKQISDLDMALQTANAQDRDKIQAEKTRLETVLSGYRDKLTKENLGQIAGPSAFEQQMLEREQLLASEQGNVGKLATLFGRPRGKYGALESQIYGKDIEAIQEAAKAGLQEKATAEKETDISLESYGEQLKESQKSVESALKKESDKLDILKMSPQELTTYNKQKLTEIFGKDVDKLFNFEGDKPVSTKSTSTKKALEDRLTQLKAESGKYETSKSKAQQVMSNQLKNAYMPVDKFGNPGESDFNIIKNNINKQGDEQTKNSIAYLENQLKNAIDKGNSAEAERIMSTVRELYRTPGATAGLKSFAPSGPEPILPEPIQRGVENVGRANLAIATGGLSEVKPIRQAASWLGKKLFG